VAVDGHGVFMDALVPHQFATTEGTPPARMIFLAE